MTFSRDTALGLFAMALAGAYLGAGAEIPESLLSDSVGANGVPRVIGYGLATVGLVLAARSLWRPASTDEDDNPAGALARAVGLLAILVGYLVIVERVGYPVSVALLIAASAAYAGAKPDARLAAAAIGGAALFWLMFGKLLGIPLPGGIFG